MSEAELRDAHSREFERHVRSALGSLHDIPRLQLHPLARAAATGSNGRDPISGSALQQCIFEAIDALRPQVHVADERASRLHRLLTLRYVEGLEAAHAWQRLGIGKSEYHREHGRAISAVASVL